MRLCNGRNKVINLFEDKNIKPSGYSYNAKFEESEEEKLEPEFEKNIPERTRIRRQKKSNEKNILNEFGELIAEKNWIIDKYLIKKHFGFKSLIDMQNNLCETKKYR